jgi:hypothetical protein
MHDHVRVEVRRREVASMAIPTPQLASIEARELVDHDQVHPLHRVFDVARLAEKPGGRPAFAIDVTARARYRFAVPLAETFDENVMHELCDPFSVGRRGEIEVLGAIGGAAGVAIATLDAEISGDIGHCKVDGRVALHVLEDPRMHGAGRRALARIEIGTRPTRLDRGRSAPTGPGECRTGQPRCAS